MNELKKTPGGLVLLGGRLCLDFCNTVSERHTAPRDMLARDQYGALLYWCAELELITHPEAEHLAAWQTTHPADAKRLYERAVQLREAIYQIGLAAIARRAAPPDALAVINDWLQQAMSARQIVTLADGQFAWHWRAADAPERPLWMIALSAAAVLLDEDLTRLRQCPGCGWLFYDHSKNNSRTWCDMRYCGNRAKNKRFHTRHKQAHE